eukprot:GEMP01013751.1.p1 GENE.GEMP01013751.1~~GEMP01013751.1.p1  ORF type:complete len:772 (+),score=118.47 GEMP01013751.1:222-2537(+)
MCSLVTYLLIGISQGSTLNTEGWIQSGPDVQKWSDPWSGADFSMDAVKFAVGNARPFNPKTDYLLGPADVNFRYSTHKRFFPIKSSTKDGVVWQDNEGSAHLTWYDRSTKSTTDHSIPLGPHVTIAALAHNGLDAFVFCSVQRPGPPTNDIANDPITQLQLVRAEFKTPTLSPTITKRRTLKIKGAQTSASPDSFDARFAQSSMGSMAWNEGKVRLVLAKGRDSSIHYNAVGATFDAETLDIIFNPESLASHSWGHSVHALQAGGFMSVNAGDNFPRGFILHYRHLGEGKTERVVYFYKQAFLAHANKPNNNDNELYNELARDGVVEMSNKRVAVVFSGEGENGHSSLSGPTGRSLNVPRNVAVVIVPIDLADDRVFSKGPVETGSLLDSHNVNNRVSHKGVQWLTHSKSMNENASRVKAVRMGEKLVIMYEIWSRRAFAGKVIIMAINNDGDIVHPAVQIPAHYNIRLCPTDDLVSFDGNSAVFYRGDADGKMIRYEMRLVGATGTPATAAPTTQGGGLCATKCTSKQVCLNGRCVDKCRAGDNFAGCACQIGGSNVSCANRLGCNKVTHLCQPRCDWLTKTNCMCHDMVCAAGETCEAGLVQWKCVSVVLKETDEHGTEKADMSDSGVSPFVFVGAGSAFCVLMAVAFFVYKMKKWKVHSIKKCTGSSAIDDTEMGVPKVEDEDQSGRDVALQGTAKLSKVKDPSAKSRKTRPQKHDRPSQDGEERRRGNQSMRRRSGLQRASREPRGKEERRRVSLQSRKIQPGRSDL